LFSSARVGTFSFLGKGRLAGVGPGEQLAGEVREGVRQGAPTRVADPQAFGKGVQHSDGVEFDVCRLRLGRAVCLLERGQQRRLQLLLALLEVHLRLLAIGGGFVGGKRAQPVAAGAAQQIV